MIPVIAAVGLTFVLALTAEDRFAGLVLGAFCIVVASLIFLGLLSLSRFIAVRKQQVPHRYAALVMKQERRMRIVLGPTEISQNGEHNFRIELKDLRDRRMPIQQECTTSDNAKVRLSWVAWWSICDIERYLDGAVEPEAILEEALRSAMLYQVARHAKKDLAGKLAEIADPIATQASSHVCRYGISVRMAEITHVEIPGDPPKSPKPGEAEAERMRNLDAAVKEAHPRTVLHIERQTRFGQPREPETK
ncbi:MAG: SPFH domain-containing protein [Anaerolineae bacterium]|nr:SPFH domain-containing protein [Candidatus Roseilinea sp.]MDW8449967.1 SPFH domain-containing protein [Anaerolineae bacterium]